MYAKLGLQFCAAWALASLANPVLAQQYPPPAPTAPPPPTAPTGSPPARPQQPQALYPQAPRTQQPVPGSYGQRPAAWPQQRQSQRMRQQGQPTAMPKKQATPPKGHVDGEDDKTGDRTLKGHTFHYPRLFPNAFTAASFYVGSSVEFYQQKGIAGKVTSSDGQTLSEFNYDRDLGFVRLRYGIDFRPTSFMTFGLDADYLAEIGANEETLFLYGGQTGFDFRPNLKLRIVRSTRYGSQLGIRAHGTFQAGLRAVPQGLLGLLESELSAIASSVEKQRCLIAADFNCVFSDTSANVADAIKLSRNRNGGGASLNYAQSLNRYLSGQFSFGVEGTSTTVTAPNIGDIKASGLQIHAGFSPAINLYPKAPVGLVYEYKLQYDKQTYDVNEAAGIAAEQKVAALSHRMGFGLYYTGRRDLLLGWVAGLNFLEDVDRALNEVETQPDSFIFAAQFEMRYFF